MTPFLYFFCLLITFQFYTRLLLELQAYYSQRFSSLTFNITVWQIFDMFIKYKMKNEYFNICPPNTVIIKKTKTNTELIKMNLKPL